MDYIYIYIYTVIFGFKMLVCGGAGGNLLLKTSTRTHKNQISPESHPRSVGSSWRWDLYQHFAEVLNGMFPSKKARTPTLEPPSNLQLILHHFRGKKHQMFGWKPPPSGRLFLGGFINLPKDYLGGNQPLLFVHFDWTTQENEQSLVSGARACGKMHETFMYQNYAEQRGAKNQVSIWLQKFPCQMFFTVCHGRTIDFMAVAENLPKDIWYMRLSFEGIFVAVHLVFAAAFQALSKGYEAPDPTCAMGGMGSCCPGPDDKEGGLQRRSKVELKHII